MSQPVPTKNDIVMIAPELSGELNNVFAYFINMAVENVDPTKFAPVYTMAVSYLTAHLMTMRRRRGDGGPVTEKHAGAEGISYGMYTRQSALTQTAYGLEYLQLMRSFICSVTVT